MGLAITEVHSENKNSSKQYENMNGIMELKY